MTVRARKETEEQIRFLAEKSGLTQTQLLADIIDAVFNVSCTYESLNLEYEFDGDSVKILASGKNNLICGEQKMPDSVLKEEKKAGETLMVKFKGEKTYKKVNEK